VCGGEAMGWVEKGEGRGKEWQRRMNEAYYVYRTDPMISHAPLTTPSNQFKLNSQKPNHHSLFPFL